MQQKHRFLPRILAVEEMWGQGFSEPGAGSDLAAVRTRAVLDDDGWRIDGQKVWTTFGDRADWLYVLCRTDPDPGLRHRGLTLLLVPVDQPGVEIRPIENIARTAEFSECFFNDARTTEDMVVGGVGDGWPVVMSTLGRERGSALMPMQLAVEREVGELIELAKARGAIDDRRIRQRLVDAYIGVHVMRSTNLRVVSDLLGSGDDAAGGRPPRRPRPASCSRRPIISGWVSWPSRSWARKRCSAVLRLRNTRESCSCSAAPRRSTAVRRRFSATSSPSACWAFPDE